MEIFLVLYAYHAEGCLWCYSVGRKDRVNPFSSKLHALSDNFDCSSSNRVIFENKISEEELVKPTGITQHLHKYFSTHQFVINPFCAEATF